jgi:hypothetical protein
VRGGQPVGLAHDRLAALRHDDRRAGRDAVVAEDVGREAGQRLHALLALRERVDVGVRRLPHRGGEWRHAERNCERLGQPAGREPVGDGQSGTRHPLGGQHQGGTAEETQLQQLAAPEFHAALPQESEPV